MQPVTSTGKVVKPYSSGVSPLDKGLELRKSCKSADYLAIKLLLLHDPQLVNSKGQTSGKTPLHFAIDGAVDHPHRLSDYLKIIKALVNSGADLSLQSNHQADGAAQTAFEYANSVAYVPKEVIQLLKISQLAQLSMKEFHATLTGSCQVNAQAYKSSHSKTQQLMLKHYAKWGNSCNTYRKLVELCVARVQNKTMTHADYYHAVAQLNSLHSLLRLISVLEAVKENQEIAFSCGVLAYLLSAYVLPKIGPGFMVEQMMLKEIQPESLNGHEFLIFNREHTNSNSLIKQPQTWSGDPVGVDPRKKAVFFVDGDYEISQNYQHHDFLSYAFEPVSSDLELLLSNMYYFSKDSVTTIPELQSLPENEKDLCQRVESLLAAVLKLPIVTDA